MAIELRLEMFEDGHRSRTLAYRIDDRQLSDAVKVKNLGRFNSPELWELNQRRGQNELTRDIVALLGRQIVDFRDDRDGWNSERRAEIIANAGSQ